MMNNNNGFRVINGGLSNEEYAARQLRKEDLEVWGDYREWDESIAEHILYYADEYEVERFMEYLAEDDEEEVAPQLYAVNSDESYDEDDITYLEYEVEIQELLRKQELEIAELRMRQEKEMYLLQLQLEEKVLATGIAKLLGRFIASKLVRAKEKIRRVFGAK